MRWIILIWIAFSAPAFARDIGGSARFSDGDTLTLDGVAIRLFGIDAPEFDQSCTRADGTEWACGKWAAEQAALLFKGQAFTCQPVDTDRYGRTVATCLAGGQDVGESLVRNGIATAYRAYSTRYISAEKAASLTETGIWQGTIETPSTFRADKAAARATENAAQAPDGCLIKGNISERGQIYHLPGQDGYARTMINEAKGEHWFCSEAEAEAAGWRRAGE